MWLNNRRWSSRLSRSMLLLSLDEGMEVDSCEEDIIKCHSLSQSSEVFPLSMMTSAAGSFQRSMLVILEDIRLVCTVIFQVGELLINSEVILF